MIPRFRHILIPLDFTEKNLAALNIAFDLAVVNHAVTTLLHVVEEIQGEQDAEAQQFYDGLRNRADAELETLSQRFDEAGLIVERKVRIGKRLTEIVVHSDEHNVDLIVMSSHVPDLTNPIETWNTLSYQVSVLCSCPVLLVK